MCVCTCVYVCVCVYVEGGRWRVMELGGGSISCPLSQLLPPQLSQMPLIIYPHLINTQPCSSTPQGDRILCLGDEPHRAALGPGLPQPSGSGTVPESGLTSGSLSCCAGWVTLITPGLLAKFSKFQEMDCCLQEALSDLSLPCTYSLQCSHSLCLSRCLCCWSGPLAGLDFHESIHCLTEGL